MLVDAPGQPAGSRVAADIGAFAQQRGFVRQSADPAPSAQYLLGEIRLDVAYQSADLRVIAYLHSFSSRLSHKFADQFFRDFHQQYAARYGEQDPVFENDYTDDGSGPSGGLGGGNGRGSGGGGRGSGR